MRNQFGNSYMFAINLTAVSVFVLAISALIHMSMDSYTVYVVATTKPPAPIVQQASTAPVVPVKACTTEQAIQWWVGSGRDLKAAKKEFCKS